MYDKYGVDPLSCEAKVTDDERRQMENDLHRQIPAQKAKAYKDCIAECGDNQSAACINPCVENHKAATVDRCADRCLEHGLIIDPQTGSINCAGAREITFSVTGGKAPYKWSASVGTLDVADDTMSARLTPPVNQGAGVAGLAYRKLGQLCGQSNGSTLNYFTRIGYGCNDQVTEACAFFLANNDEAILNGCGVPPPCGDSLICAGTGDQVCNSGCAAGQKRFTPTEMGNPCALCNPAGAPMTCDKRTPTMISNNCVPCAFTFDSGAMVSVSDKQGLSATAVVTG
jgi:hypothetical protein